MLWTKREWRALLSSEQKAKLICLHCQHGWTLSPWKHTSAYVWGRLQFQQGEVPLSVWAFSNLWSGSWGRKWVGHQRSVFSGFSLQSQCDQCLVFLHHDFPMMYCTSDWAKVNPPFFRKVFCQTVRKVANTQSALFPTPTRSCNF